MGREELMRKARWKSEAKKKGVDAKKYAQEQKAKRGSTWTNRNDLIIQARAGSGEKVGEHVSRHRGAGGKGKPSNWQRLKNTVRRATGGDMTTKQNTNTTSNKTQTKKRYISPYERKHGRKQR